MTTPLKSLVSLRLSRASFVGLLFGAALLSGCALQTTALPSTEPETIQVSISGLVHGGEQPISGATVTLWQTGTTGYGAGAATLKATTTTAVGTGSFTLPTTAISCNTGTSAYITAAGGDPTGQTTTSSNHAILLVAVLSACSGVSNSTVVNIDEVTTVAAAYSLSNFSTVTGAAGSNASLNIGAPSTKAQGLSDAIANATLLASTTTGLANASSATHLLPTSMLNSLADIAQSCVNAAEYNSGPCPALFGYATPPSGTQPANIFQALINIAHYPGANVASLLGMIPVQAAFLPDVTATSASSTAAPNDLTLGIGYPNSTFASIGQTGSAISIQSGAGIAIDGSDNVWITGIYNGTTTSTYNYITELSAPSSGPAYTSTLGNTAALNGTHTVRLSTFDTAGNLWLTDKNSTGGSVIEIPKASLPIGATEQTAFASSLDANDWAIAVDSTNNIWTASYGGQGNCTTATSGTTCAYVEYQKSGSTYTPVSTFGTPTPATVNTATVRGIAVDNVSTAGKGNVWATEYGDFSGTVEPGSAVTVMTPSSGAVTSITIGSGANEPLGIALDASGNGYITAGASAANSGLYVVNQGASSASPVSVTGNTATTPVLANILTANASTPASNATAPLSVGGLNVAGYDVVDGRGNIFISNYAYGSIVEYSPSTATPAFNGYLSPYYGFAPSLSLPSESVSITAVTLSAGPSNLNGTANLYNTSNNVVAGQTITFPATGQPGAFTVAAYQFMNGNTYTITPGSANYFVINSNQSGATVSKTTAAATGAVAGTSQAVFTCPTGTTITCSFLGNQISKNNSVAIDRAGTIWTLSNNNATLYSIIGTAAPTDPILADGATGSLP